MTGDDARDDRIVVGVDGSGPSRQALRWAQFLARSTACTVEVVAAWQPLTHFGSVGAGWVIMPPDWDQARDAEKGLTSTLDEVFGDDRPVGLRITVREGNPAQVLLKISRDARMLIVGSRGHGGFAGVLLGSVSATCAEHARCPVLVLHGNTPPPGRGADPPADSGRAHRTAQPLVGESESALWFLLSSSSRWPCSLADPRPTVRRQPPIGTTADGFEARKGERRRPPHERGITHLVEAAASRTGQSLQPVHSDLPGPRIRCTTPGNSSWPSSRSRLSPTARD